MSSATAGSQLAEIEFEKHYTIAEFAEILNMSFERTRLLIKDEPGVLKFGPKHPTPVRRVKYTYRIPESVVRRILRRSANPT